MSDQPIVIAADGSCLSNPGPGGWAWAVSNECWGAGGHPGTTNNLMELRAVFEALAAVSPSTPLVVETDSMYVINVFTQWLEGWKASAWRTSSRKPVANQSAIQAIEGMLAGRNVQWRHVKGHSGHRLNEVVDTRARDAATAIRDGKAVNTGNVMACPEEIRERAGS